MKNKKITHKERNWFLVFISSILIIIGVASIVIATIHASNLGWWSLAIAVSGLITTAAAITSIVKNDPRWILLDLIIPG